MAWSLVADKPVYIQLIEHIKRRILAGVYPPGSRLISVRELAVESGVNPNTMQKSLQELERLGLIRTERTSGRYVTSDEELIKSMRMEILDEETRVYIEKIKKLGFTNQEIQDYITKIIGGI